MFEFGTDGWRAVIGADFTFANVEAFAQGVARWLRTGGLANDGVIVGYDRRFLSDEFARTAAAALAAGGARVGLATRASPTPAISLAARDTGAALAMIITASHNPYQYNGIKLRGSDGAPLSRSAQDQLSLELRRTGHAHHRANPLGQIRSHDPWPAYERQLRSLVDLDAIIRRRMALIHDAMYGSAAGWLRRLLPGTRTIRSRHEPTFGRGAPEPLDANLGSLRRKVIGGSRLTIGLATDGDGDRLAALDETGAYVDSHHLLAILYRHLVEVRGLRGGAVRTVTTSTLLDRLALIYGQTVVVTPVGFRHIAGQLQKPMEPPLIIGGEESGGIGITLHLPERDALFAAVLLLEHLVSCGLTLRECLGDLESKIGRLCLGRTDIPLPPNAPAGRRGLSDEGLVSPQRLLGEPVLACQRFDGYRLTLSDGAWLHLRCSGTEPVLRVYAEADSPRRLAALLDAGRSLVLTGSAAAASQPVAAAQP